MTDWMFSAPNSFQQRSIDINTQQNDVNNSIDNYFANELCANLKKNYEERFFLHFHIVKISNL